LVKIDPDEPCPCGSGKPYRNCHQAAQQQTAPEVSEHRPLTEIPEPDPGTRTVFEWGGDREGLFLVGSESSISYDCASCNAPLYVGLAPGAVQNIVFRCPRCGTFNES
jgi:hypothetical protein